jgi:hypothetical protein
VKALPYLADHRVQDEVCCRRGYVEMALAAAAEVYGPGAYAVEQMAFEQLLAVPSAEERLTQVVLTEEGPGRASLQVSTLETRRGTGEGMRRRACGSSRQARKGLRWRRRRR